MEVYIVMYRKNFDEALAPVGVFDDYEYADAVARELVEEHGGGGLIQAFQLNAYYGCW